MYFTSEGGVLALDENKDIHYKHMSHGQLSYIIKKIDISTTVIDLQCSFIDKT